MRDTTDGDRTEIEPHPFGGGVSPDDVDAPVVHVVDEGIELRLEDAGGRTVGRIISDTPGDLERVRVALRDSIAREQAARGHQAGDLSGVGRSEIPK